MDRKVRSALDKAIKAHKQRQYTYGFIGKSSTSTPTECIVTSRPDFVYVRVTSPGTQSQGIARNIGSVPIRADTPIRMITEGGNLTIESVDYSNGRWLAATDGDTLNIYGVIKHNHKIGSGLEYEIESLRLEPGRVYCPGHDMIAVINGFRHDLGTYSTGAIDLTSYAPTSGHHRWVLVGIDPSDNSEVAVGSVEVTTGTSLTITDIDAILFTGYIPLGAFQLSYGDTELSQYAYEAREWLSSPLILFDDTEGNPEDVITGSSADGTSEFAARRDHKHHLADGLDFLASDGSTLGATSASQKFTKNVASSWYDYNNTNGDDFNTFTGYPSGWVEVNAPPSGVGFYDIAGFWKVFSYYGVPNWKYTLQTLRALELAESNFIFGPIMLMDNVNGDDQTYYFTVYRDNVGAIDPNTYCRVALNWDSGTQVWRVRMESKNGTTQYLDSWVNLIQPTILQPFWLSVFTNVSKAGCTATFGYTPHFFTNRVIGSRDLSAQPTWGYAHLQIDFVRLTTDTVTNSVIYIGGYDILP